MTAKVHTGMTPPSYLPVESSHQITSDELSQIRKSHVDALLAVILNSAGFLNSGSAGAMFDFFPEEGKKGLTPKLIVYKPRLPELMQDPIFKKMLTIFKDCGGKTIIARENKATFEEDKKEFSEHRNDTAYKEARISACEDDIAEIKKAKIHISLYNTISQSVEKFFELAKNDPNLCKLKTQIDEYYDNKFPKITDNPLIKTGITIVVMKELSKLPLHLTSSEYLTSSQLSKLWKLDTQTTEQTLENLHMPSFNIYLPRP